MKPGIPWSVKGIDQQAREAAKDAARRSGMTLGEWLNTLIKEEAEQGPEKSVPRYRPTLERERGDDIGSKLDRLAEQLNKLTRQGSETAANRFTAHAVQTDDADSIAALIDRVERNEREAAALIGDVVQRLDQIEQVNAELARRPVSVAPLRPEDVPGFASLETALRNVVGHIESNDPRVRDTLRSIQDRLSNLTARVDKADRGGDASDRASLGALEARVEELAKALADGERTKRPEVDGHVEDEIAKLSRRLEAVAQSLENSGPAQAGAIEAAREAREVATRASGDIAKLAQRLDALKAESDTSQQRIQSVASQVAQREARDVERRLQSSLEEAQRGAASAQESAQEVKRALAGIEGLEQRFEEIKREAAPESELRALKLSVEQLSATVTQGVGGKPLTELERRLAEFGERLDSVAPSGHLVAHLGELETRVHQLDARLKEALHATADSVSLESFEAQSRQNGERLAAIEHKLDHVATLERSVAQLFQSLDESRAWAKGVADEAAREMAERVRVDRGGEVGPSLELSALEAGLAAVKASADTADRRTQETLEAVHETLEQIIGKLAELEGREQSEPAPAPPMVASAMETTHGEGGPEWTSDAVLPQPEYPDLSDFDPGPVPATPASTADFDTSVVLRPDPDEGSSAAEEPVQEDFIAAARRAAQSGSRNGFFNGLSGLSKRPEAPASDDEGVPAVEKRARFKLPFRRQKVKGVTAATPETGEAPNRSGSRKRLILAGLLLLAAVAAYATQRTNLMSRFTRPAASPSSEITQPVRKAELGGAWSDTRYLLGPDVTLASAKQDVIPKSDPLILAAGLLTTASFSTVQSARSAASDRLDGDGSFARKGNFERGPRLDAPLPLAARRPAVMPPAGVGPESLRQAAMAGDANAAFIVASRFLDGQSVGRDFGRAAEWFGRAAKQGLAPAQYRLATLFERGLGVERNRVAALAWYLRAAGNGNVKSMHNLAVMYADREQAQPRYELAARWFRAAAELGLKDSQYNLAVLTERGLGIAASRENAYLWYSVAAKQGDADAERRAATLATSLDKGVLSGLRQRAAEWTAEPPIRNANFVAMLDPSWQVAAVPSASHKSEETASANTAAASEVNGQSPRI